jgi:hypothetical protein
LPRHAVGTSLRCAAIFALGSLSPLGVRAQSSESAQPSGLVIAWQGPEDCQRGPAVQAKALRLLGSSRHALEPFEVSVTVKREGGGRYVAELKTRAAAGVGKKRLEGESCDAIALASAVVIALSVDPEASLDSEAEPAPAPEHSPPPPPRRAEPAPPPPPPASPQRELTGYVQGSFGVLLSMLDEPSVFAGAGVGARYRRFGIELGGAIHQRQQVTLVDRTNVGAELHLYTGELLGCYAAVPLSWGALDACAGARLEYLSATAFGVSNPDHGSVLILAGLAALRGRWRATSWLSATLDLAVAARPFHPTFVLLGVGDVYEIPLVSPLARAGLALEF